MKTYQIHPERHTEQEKLYVVTGVDRKGKRFKFVYDELHTALRINLWRGNVWSEVEGKRKLLKSAYN